MRVYVAGMGAARLEDVDPQAVEAEAPTAEVERRLLRESGDVAAEDPRQLGEAGVALRKVGQRGVGGVAAVVMLLRSVPPRAILSGEGEARLLQLSEEIRVVQPALIEAGDEEGADGHLRLGCPRGLPRARLENSAAAAARQLSVAAARVLEVALAAAAVRLTVPRRLRLRPVPGPCGRFPVARLVVSICHACGIAFTAFRSTPPQRTPFSINRAAAPS